MNNKRAQLSVETMIIYGLVILVTLSVIGGLLYFNVLDLGSYLPDRCDIGGAGDLKCEEMKFSTSPSPDAMELGIRNIGQKPIQSLTVSVTDDEGVHFANTVSGVATVNGAQIAPGNTLAPGDIAKVVVQLSGDTAKAGKTLRGVLVTEYQYKDGVVMQESVGNIRIKVS